MAAAAPAIVRRWAATPPIWLSVPAAPADDDASLQALDIGERAVIALAATLPADLILMDDRDGVTKARDRGFAVTGTLGLLIRAASGGLIDLPRAHPSRTDRMAGPRAASRRGAARQRAFASERRVRFSLPATN